MRTNHSDKSSADLSSLAGDRSDGGLPIPSSEGDTNVNAFTQVFRRLNHRLLHLARGILRNDMEAEDVVQESFCRIWERRDQLNSAEEVAAIITTTVKHVSIDALRTQNLRGTINIEDVAEPTQTSEDEVQSAEERFQHIEDLIESQLSPAARHVLRRREYDGADFDTIAQELGIQPTAVRMHLSRARQKIMNAYLEQQRHEN